MHRLFPPARPEGPRTAVLVVLSTLAIGAGGGCGEESGTAPRPTVTAPVHAEVSYAFDPANKRDLVAFADNVFVGRVAKRLGTMRVPTSDPATTIPKTRFEVAVLEKIKGRLPPRVTVNQYGGLAEAVVEERGRRVLKRRLQLWEGDRLLRPGEVVLLATGKSAGRDSHTITAQPFADRRIRGHSEEAKLVREFKRAHRADRDR